MNQNIIINAFLEPEFYEHPVEQIELIETHISWVFLTGQFAYKVKKPVDFGFLNFSTLERRKFYCQQELILNRRFAPQVYLQVLPVTLLDNMPSLSGRGTIIDYAIKMRQFEQYNLLDKRIKKQQVSLAHIEHLSDVVADFHKNITIADAELEFGSAAEVLRPVQENFAVLLNTLASSRQQDMLQSLQKQMLSIYHALYPHLQARKKQGHIRECHGDLHLGNITLSGNEIVLFDGIEFNDSLRWIDTMSDCAFLLMDLQDHKQSLFANHMLNRYLSKTGDYSGLKVLVFYLLYRATVRAKVAALRLQQEEKNSTAYQDTASELSNYLQLSQAYVRSYNKQSTAFLAISFGLSGSGKSHVCTQLADQLGAIQISSDVERKRLFANVVQELYSDSATQKTYTHLMKLAELVLDAGYALIVDATFLDKQWREQFRLIAEKHQLPFHILHCYAQQDILKQRLRARQTEISHISDADISVMQSQLNKVDELDGKENKYEIAIDTGQPLDIQSIIKTLKT